MKQDARRTVREALSVRRMERLEVERRQGDQAVRVLTVIAERDAAIAAADQAAAAAVRSLLGEGLDLAEIEVLCGAAVGVKELQRLAKLPVIEAGEKAS